MPRTRRWLPFVLLGGTVGVLALDLVTGRLLNQVFLALPGLDKVGHVACFGALFVGVRWLVAAGGVPPRWHTAAAATASLTLGVLLELMQGVAHSGSMEAADLIADVSGVALGWVAAAKPPARTAAGATIVALAAAGVVTYQTHVRLADYARAQRLMRQGDLVSARASLLRAVDAGFTGPDLYNDLAWIEVESGVGDPGRAVDYARVALAARPRDADVLDTYGWALHHAGRSQAALAPLLDAYTRKPDMYCIHYHLATVYLALGREQDAASHFRRQLAFAGTREARLAQQALDRLAARP